jgi:transcriptional regulator GlxA family with amidase domain
MQSQAAKSRTKPEASHIRRGIRRIAIVAVTPVRMLDLIGPAEVFGDANRLHGDRPVYEIEIISACDDRTVTSHIGVPFIADSTFGETRGPIDTLLVAGGLGAREMRYSPKFLAWLKEQSKKVRRFGSVCTGALILADAGLLDGRHATTHWNWCGELARTHPRVKVDPNPIYVRDQELYTSAGVTAGIDLALALVEEDLGPSLALRVAQMMVVFLRRPAGQAQFSATLTAQTSENRTLRELLAWAADHLTDELSVDSLARRAAMSERNFSRVFTHEVGETPARHIETLRLEAARRQLEASSLSLDEVAEHSGFASAEVLRRVFNRRLGVSPGQYRLSFGRRR